MVKLLFDKLPVNFHVGAGYNVLRRTGWRLLLRTSVRRTAPLGRCGLR